MLLTEGAEQLNILLTDAASVPNPAADLWQYKLYLGAHLLALVFITMITFLTMKAKASRAQTAVALFEIGALVYILGFVQEILSDTSEGGFIACITQYFGEFTIFIAAVFFTAQLCSVKIPKWVYILQTVFSYGALAALMATRTSHLFYNSIGVNRDGAISRPEIDHGIMFFASSAYFLVISIFLAKICIADYKDASPLQKKRLKYLMLAMLAAWAPWIMTLSGITNGYEIPAIGIAFAAVFLYCCFIRYGFFDSQMLAGANAMEHGKEGILVVDSKYRVSYQNSKINEIFGHLQESQDMMEHNILADVFKGTRKTYEQDGKIYEFFSEPLMEGSYVLGYMLWVNDATEHYSTIEQIRHAATHDTLTDLYNRSRFQTLVEEDLEDHKLGTFVIFDLDNFKNVNDSYGHQCGDGVLNTLASVLKHYGEQRLYSCRLGGDEFCVYLRNVTEKKEIETILQRIFDYFDEGLTDAGFGGYTSLSAGASTATEGISYKKLYNDADEQLYTAKTTGKHQFRIAER